MHDGVYKIILRVPHAVGGDTMKNEEDGTWLKGEGEAAVSKTVEYRWKR